MAHTLVDGGHRRIEHRRRRGVVQIDACGQVRSNCERKRVAYIATNLPRSTRAILIQQDTPCPKSFSPVPKVASKDASNRDAGPAPPSP